MKNDTASIWVNWPLLYFIVAAIVCLYLSSYLLVIISLGLAMIIWRKAYTITLGFQKKDLRLLIHIGSYDCSSDYTMSSDLADGVREKGGTVTLLPNNDVKMTIPLPITEEELFALAADMEWQYSINKTSNSLEILIPA